MRKIYDHALRFFKQSYHFIKNVINWDVLLNAFVLFVLFVFVGWLAAGVLKLDIDKNKYTQLLFWFIVIDGSFVSIFAFNKKYSREDKKLTFFLFNFLFVFLVSFVDEFRQGDYSLLLFFVSLNLAIEQLINYKFFDKKNKVNS